MDGVVLGVLTKSTDRRRANEGLTEWRGLAGDVHRAFDERRFGIKRSKTSSIPARKDLRLAARKARRREPRRSPNFRCRGGRIVICPEQESSAQYRGSCAANESARVQSGLSAALPYGSNEYQKFEENTANWAGQIRESAMLNPLQIEEGDF